MTPTDMSRIESAMRTAMAYNEAFNRHDVPAMLQLLSEECIFEHHHPAPEGRVLKGKEAISQFWLAYFERFPQASRNIEEVFGLGRRCVLRWQGDGMGPAGGSGHLRGVDICQAADDLLIEVFSYVKG